MRRKTLTVAALACGLFLVTLFSPAPGGAQPERDRAATAEKTANRGPEIGFDYQTFIAEHLALIGSGEIDKAVDHLKVRIRNPAAIPMVIDPLKRNLAAIYGNGGLFEGHEVFGFKQLGSRIYQFHAMAYFANGPIRLTYVFELHAGEWKWLNIAYQKNLEEAAKDVPLQRIDTK